MSAIPTVGFLALIPLLGCAPLPAPDCFSPCGVSYYGGGDECSAAESDAIDLLTSVYRLELVRVASPIDRGPATFLISVSDEKFTAGDVCRGIAGSNVQVGAGTADGVTCAGMYPGGDTTGGVDLAHLFLHLADRCVDLDHVLWADRGVNAAFGIHTINPGVQ